MNTLPQIFLDQLYRPGVKQSKGRVAWHVFMLALAVGTVFLTAILRIYNWTFPGEHALLIIIDLIYFLDVLMRLAMRTTRAGRAARGKDHPPVTMCLVVDILATTLPALVDFGVLSNTLLEFARVLRVFRMVSRYDALFPYAKDMYTEHRYVLAERVPTMKKVIDDIMLLAAFASILIFLIEVWTDTKIFWMDVLAIAFDLLFLLDYSLRVIFTGHLTESLKVTKHIHEGKVHFRVRRIVTPAWQSLLKSWNNYMGRWYGIVDLLAWVFPVAYHMFNVGMFTEEFTRFARFFRIMRSARLLRFFRAFRWVKESKRLGESMSLLYRSMNKELIFSVIGMIGLVAVGTFILVLTEGKQNPSFRDPFNALYWSVMSVLGQPSTEELQFVSSKYIAIIILFCGLIVTGFVTGSITTVFINRMDSRFMGKDTITIDKHIVIFGYNSRLSELIHQMFLRKPDVKAIVVLFDRGNEKEDIIGDLHLQDGDAWKDHTVLWVKGNPRSSADIKKTGVERASSAIILADETKGIEDEEDRDALSLMTLEVLLDYLDDMAFHRVPHSEGSLMDQGLKCIENVRIKMRSKYGNTWSWKVLSGSEGIQYGGAYGHGERPQITIELLSDESARVARRLQDNQGRRKVDHIVYADDLVCKYMTLESAAEGVVDVYDDILDPARVAMVRVQVVLRKSAVADFQASQAVEAHADASHQRPAIASIVEGTPGEQKGPEQTQQVADALLCDIAHALRIRDVLFMGLQIRSSLLWRWMLEDGSAVHTCSRDQYLLPRVNEQLSLALNDRSATIVNIFGPKGKIRKAASNDDDEKGREGDRNHFRPPDGKDDRNWLQDKLLNERSYISILNPLQRSEVMYKVFQTYADEVSAVNEADTCFEGNTADEIPLWHSFYAIGMSTKKLATRNHEKNITPSNPIILPL